MSRLMWTKAQRDWISGKILGMSQRKISRLEKEDINPTPEEIVKICKFYNVSADYLLGITNDFRRLK